jgi:hypothetical protein
LQIFFPLNRVPAALFATLQVEQRKLFYLFITCAAITPTPTYIETANGASQTDPQH